MSDKELLIIKKKYNDAINDYIDCKDEIAEADKTNNAFAINVAAYHQGYAAGQINAYGELLGKTVSIIYRDICDKEEAIWLQDFVSSSSMQ